MFKLDAGLAAAFKTIGGNHAKKVGLVILMLTMLSQHGSTRLLSSRIDGFYFEIIAFFGTSSKNSYTLSNVHISFFFLG